MRGNKYKISKKRRLRRRGKYSKKLKPKSRKSGGRFPSFLRGHKKTKVQITATCDIPEFFFDIHIHNLFCELMGMSPVEQTKYPHARIDISVAGELLQKNKTADGYTLSVKLSTAVIYKAFFNNVLQVTPTKDNLLTINVTLNNFVVTKNNSYSNQGIDYSSYTPSPDLYFECKDTNDEIMKSLLHLWRKTYNPIINTRDPLFKNFNDIFDGLTQYTDNTDIVNQFRDHDYRFNVREVILSSS
jgi:hypothetical protein